MSWLRSHMRFISAEMRAVATQHSLFDQAEGLTVQRTWQGVPPWVDFELQGASSDRMP